MSSSADVSARMSSRSIGVTNVEFRRWWMSWVIRSPSCSQITMSAGQVGPVGIVREHLVEQIGAPHHVRRGLLEQVEEHAVLGSEDVGKPCHDAGERSVKTV